MWYLIKILYIYRPTQRVQRDKNIHGGISNYRRQTFAPGQEQSGRFAGISTVIFKAKFSLQ